MKGTCGGCRFFDDMLLEVDGTGRGNCVRYAPRPYPRNGDEWDQDTDTTWPRVGVAAWCGEFEAAK